jgi:hypothetical protein
MLSAIMHLRSERFHCTFIGHDSRSLYCGYVRNSRTLRLPSDSSSLRAYPKNSIELDNPIIIVPQDGAMACRKDGCFW